MKEYIVKVTKTQTAYCKVKARSEADAIKYVTEAVNSDYIEKWNKNTEYTHEDSELNIDEEKINIIPYDYCLLIRALDEIINLRQEFDDYFDSIDNEGDDEFYRIKDRYNAFMEAAYYFTELVKIIKSTDYPEESYKYIVNIINSLYDKKCVKLNTSSDDTERPKLYGLGFDDDKYEF